MCCLQNESRFRLRCLICNNTNVPKRRTEYFSNIYNLNRMKVTFRNLPKRYTVCRVHPLGTMNWIHWFCCYVMLLDLQKIISQSTNGLVDLLLAIELIVYGNYQDSRLLVIFSLMPGSFKSIGHHPLENMNIHQTSQRAYFDMYSYVCVCVTFLRFL